MTDTVLVPGSFLAAASWGATVDALGDRGVAGHPVELTGLGRRAAESASLEDHVGDVLEALESTSGPTIVVAHSYGGVPAALAMSRADEAARERIRPLFLGAALPVPGRSIFDTYGTRAAYLRGLARRHDGRTIPVFTTRQLAGWGEHGLAGQSLKHFRACTSPHPVATYEDPADEGFTWDFATKGVYVNLAHDSLPVPDEARRHMSVVDLHAGHWPMFTAPEALAELIARTAGC